jgi:hypothetical protein
VPAASLLASLCPSSPTTPAETMAPFDAVRSDVVQPQRHEIGPGKGDVFAARWHLDRLIALRPADWAVSVRWLRAFFLAAQGRAAP